MEVNILTFGERLTELRKEHGYATRNEFADKLGIPSTTLRNYETDGREPGHTFLKQISELFNVSVDYLLCLTDEKEVLNTFRLHSSEQNMIEKYRDLDPYGKEIVDTILEKECKRSVLLKDIIMFDDDGNPMLIEIMRPTDSIKRMQLYKSYADNLMDASQKYNDTSNANETEEKI